MTVLHRLLTLVFLQFLPLFLLAQVPPVIELEEMDYNRLLFEKASVLRYYHPDSALILLDNCYNNLEKKNDTLNLVHVLREQARIHGHQANYKSSYDKLWKGLLFADNAGLEYLKSTLYVDIGYYYSYFKRQEEAFDFFALSMSINKDLVKKGSLDKAFLADTYYAYCSTLRGLDLPARAQVYLDSCYMFYENGISKVHKNYIDVEKAFYLKEIGKQEEAIETFEQVIPWLQENDPGYQVLVYTYMGDAWKDKGNFTKSEQCYKNAIDVSAKYHSHLDFSPLVHERLAGLYRESGDLEAAYQSLMKVKELDERFFDSRSKNNRPLLEIQDAFRIEKENQRKLLQEQKLAELEHEERELFLQRTILGISLVFLLVIGWLFFKHVRSKHKAEKQLIRRKQELEIQKANEIVELKNKELSASTLKLIEKDEFISALHDKLSRKPNDIDVREIKRVVHSMSADNGDNWKEFEARFINVNKHFYQNLKQEYPKLTQGDLKLCALIKLNFSSKDIARLMGISVESVHTTRYRLRKKLGLNREINLTEFISKF